jgi:peptide/nickel transport system substrate-binding protein
MTQSGGSLSRRALLTLGGAAAAASVLGFRPGESLADGPPPAAEPKKKGGTFRVRLAEAPPHFDPHQTLAASTMIALSFACSRLVRVTAGASVVPGTQPIEGDLADSWDREGDTVYVFKLRRGIQWHVKPPVNGRELVAQDVKYSYDRFLSQPGNPNRALLEMVEKVEAPDKYTVKFTLREPYAWFVDRLAATSTWVIARECVEKFGDLKSWESVLGTGPWMLDRYEPNAKLRFVRNRSYFESAWPFADSVELTIDPDPVAAAAAFVAGKYDFGTEYGMTLRRSDLALAKGRIRWLPTREFLMVAGSVTAMKLDKDPFNDVRVRRAVATADNWHECLARNPLAEGKGAPNPVVPAALKDWSIRIKDLPTEGKMLYEPDPTAARQMLTEAGHAGGIRVPVEATRGYGPDWMAAVQIAVKNWKAAGIDADLKAADAGGSFDRMLVTLRDGATTTDPDIYFGALLPGNPLNTSGVNDPKLTEMIKLQRRTFKEGKRRDIVHDIQRYCSQQVYYAYGGSVSVVSAWQRNVRDFGPNIGHDYGGRLMYAYFEE